MANVKLSFWSNEATRVDTLTPHTMMGMAASELTANTKGLVRGELTTVQTKDEEEHRLDVVAVALDQKRYRILTATHTANLPYPIKIQAEYSRSLAHSEKEFVEEMRKILSGSRAVSLVQSLIARSNEIPVQRKILFSASDNLTDAVQIALLEKYGDDLPENLDMRSLPPDEKREIFERASQIMLLETAERDDLRNRLSAHTTRE